MVVRPFGRDGVERGVFGSACGGGLDRGVDAVGLFAPALLLALAGVGHGAGVSVGLGLRSSGGDLGL